MSWTCGAQGRGVFKLTRLPVRGLYVNLSESEALKRSNYWIGMTTYLQNSRSGCVGSYGGGGSPG